MPYNSGFLLEDGTLGISINTKIQEGNIINNYGSGGKVFDLIFDHFGNDAINKIRGAWLEGTNLKQFNKAMEKLGGLNGNFTSEQVKEAVFETFTGKKAQEKGFNTILDDDINSVIFNQETKRFDEVIIKFSRDSQ